MMTMVYIGVAMLVVGWVMLRFFGVSAEEFESGKPYSGSDTLASFMIVIGGVLTAAFGSFALLRFLAHEGISLFYGVDATYGQLSFWARCQISTGGSAILFFLSMTTAFHAEGQFRRVRNHNHAKAKRIRDSWNRYANWLYWIGQLALSATVLLVILKTL